MQPVRIVVITGLSGSGKSTAIKALEDLDYFCIDNLPVLLLPRFLDMLADAQNPIERMGLVIDIREGQFLAEAEDTFRAVKAEGHHIEIVFLEANDAVLLQRYSETRRKHPLALRGTVADGIKAERHALADLRHIADHVINTTHLTVHELRGNFQTLYDPSATETRRMIVNIVSFGFKAGLPQAADLVFDVRFLVNPHFVPELRPKTGLEAPVSQYVLAQQPAQEFIRHVFDMIAFLLPRYEAEGKSYLTIAFGCTGGKHRSVTIAEHTAEHLRQHHPYTINTHHRDIPHP